MLYREYHHKQIKDKTLGIIIIIITIIAFIFTLRVAIIKNDVKTCLKWQRYEKEYPLFNVNQDMEEFCDHYNIKI